MNARLTGIIVCPLCLSMGRNLALCATDNYLTCSYGHIYFIKNKIPYLRPGDEKEQITPEQLEKYEEREFVDMFTWRQYGSLVEISQQHIQQTEIDFGKMLRAQSGGDVFYRTIASFAKTVLGQDVVIVDVGCATGILTGLIAIQHPNSFCIGIDYSPNMIIRANEIVTEFGDWVFFSVRDSKTRLLPAKIRRLKLSNVNFMVGDATCIPLENNCANLVVASNLFHRVKSPQKSIGEIERIIKRGGFLLSSNSYDWKTEYTPRNLWFDNICEILDRSKWIKEIELDGVPFFIPTYNRKFDLALNHITLFKKNKKQP